jgi:hypothetical protein
MKIKRNITSVGVDSTFAPTSAYGCILNKMQRGDSCVVGGTVCCSSGA